MVSCNQLYIEKQKVYKMYIQFYNKISIDFAKNCSIFKPP